MNDSAPTLSADNGTQNESEKRSENLVKTKSMQPTKTQPSVLLKLSVLQGISTLAFALGVYYFTDAREALSAAFGGVIAVIGSLYSAGRLFTAKHDAAATEILIRFYISVMLKIAFTLLMMGICLIVIKASVLPFIISYLIAAVIMNLLVLLVPSKLD